MVSSMRIMRVGGKAQDLRAFGAQRQDFGDHGVGVVGVAIVAAVLERAPDLLAQAPVGGEGQERIDAGARVDHRPLPGMAALGGGGGEAARTIVRGKPARSRAAGDEDGGVFVRQQPAAEIGELGGELLVDGAEARLLLRRRRRAGAHELVARALQQAQLLGVEAKRRRAAGKASSMRANRARLKVMAL